MAEQSLKDKTVKGVAWSGIDNVAQFGVTFIVSIVLARLLSPDDYGLIGITGIFTAICTTIIDGGFKVLKLNKVFRLESKMRGPSNYIYPLVLLFLMRMRN